MKLFILITMNFVYCLSVISVKFLSQLLKSKQWLQGRDLTLKKMIFFLRDFAYFFPATLKLSGSLISFMSISTIINFVKASKNIPRLYNRSILLSSSRTV